MSEPVHLSETELVSLQKILAIEDLESQKRMAYPFWGLAGITFLISQVALFWDPLVCIALMPVAFAMLMLGMARLGYYRLYRMLHHQKEVFEGTGTIARNE
ncbi:hypothetical protein FYZ48_00460 [Gimesia chilikensis]|uniref:hypothetical protein n=1 Tax=Gimesia chilikensis TaxID=2605989 RepID=UPI0011EF95C0|nr:hypothetical protein [Gimesia chilikensis]KAA0142895.1 hypothetical protein FYZ48_00460 [Gimesia chilikensis]